MTEKDMFEKSFMRPTNFFSLSSEEQYNIDKSLGILDWQGDTLSEADIVRYKNHYTIMKTIQVTEEQYELLKTFKNLLMNQNTHGTSDPVYCVEKQVTVYGMDSDYASEYSWIVDSDVELSTDKELFDYLIENEYEEALKEVYYLNTEETEYSLEALEEDFLNDISCYNTDGNYEEVLSDMHIRKVYYRKDFEIETINGLFSLFEKDIKNYVTKDTTQYHSYASSSYRCSYMNKLRKLLIDLQLE